MPVQDVQVTQQVVHMEPPAEIQPQEAAQFVAVQHACFVERNLNAMADAPTIDGHVGHEENIWLCKLNRNTKPLRSALCVGPSLQPCRDALEGAGHPWRLPSGALAFMHPSQYRMVMIALGSRDLQPDHIVVAESLEYLVEEALDRHNGRCRGRQLINVGISVSELATSSSEPICQDGEEIDQTSGTSDRFHVIVQRTFLCSVPIGCGPCMVTASTTDAHSACGANPRRGFMSDLWA